MLRPCAALDDGFDKGSCQRHQSLE
jgi:hypothetical protein